MILDLQVWNKRHLLPLSWHSKNNVWPVTLACGCQIPWRITKAWRWPQQLSCPHTFQRPPSTLACPSIAVTGRACAFVFLAPHHHDARVLLGDAPGLLVHPFCQCHHHHHRVALSHLSVCATFQARGKRIECLAGSRGDGVFFLIAVSVHQRCVEAQPKPRYVSCPLDSNLLFVLVSRAACVENSCQTAKVLF